KEQLRRRGRVRAHETLPWLGRSGLPELQQFDGRTIVHNKCDANARRWRIRRNQQLTTCQGFVEIVHRERDVRHSSDERGNLAIWVESHPLDPIRAALESADVDTKCLDMLFVRTRLRMWDAEVVIPPSELGDDRGRFLRTSRRSHQRANGLF